VPRARRHARRVLATRYLLLDGNFPFGPTTRVTVPPSHLTPHPFFLIAAQGLLTGKYTRPGAELPKGPRGATFASRTDRARPLVELLRELGEQHGGKTPAQVAINWCLCKGVVPIPGAKNRAQVEEAAGAMGWRLKAEEVDALDEASAPIAQLYPNAPFENW